MRYLLFLLFLLVSNYVFSSYTINDNHEIQINPQIQVRQGLNQCGPASAMAVINAYTNKVMPLDFVDSEMGNRMGNRMTYPWGITTYLKEYGINYSFKVLMFRSDKSRLKYLKKTLSENKPIILLNDLNGILHYFTLLGYNMDNEFYIYDSMQPVKVVNDLRMTVDSNGKKPGNLTLDKETLFQRWERAKYKFINYLVIVPKEGIL